MADNNSQDNKNKNSAAPPDSSDAEKAAEQIFTDLSKSSLADEWQKIFEELKIDDEEYKIFLSASTKVDDPDPFPRPPKK